MSLRLKLIITYIVMLIVSVSLIVVFGVGIITGAIADTVQALIGAQTPEQAITRIVDVAVDLRYTEKYHPETLATDEFARQIANQVHSFDGFLLVEKNRQFKAYGVENFDESLYDTIAASTQGRYAGRRSSGDIGFGQHGLDFGKSRIQWNGAEYNILKYDFQEYSEGLSFYFLVKINNAEKVMGRYNGALFALLIVLTVIVIGPLLLIITKDIVNPLRKLESCAREIARGNLDFRLLSKSNNEVGSVIRSYEIMRTELKKSILRQLEMEENRKQLLSSITHDLKTPITSIKGYIQGIRDGVANEPVKLNKYLDVIYTKTEDMNDMIDDLFLFSKLDLRKEAFNKDFVDIEDFYSSFVQELHLELDGKGVELVTECQVTQGLKVLMDSQKIKRVALNIVSNAVKFMDKEQKRLQIAFVEQNGGLTVRIRDNGIGIDQKDLEKIFDRFYRTDPSRNRNTGGSGLGLAIAKQIVEQHGGTIQAGSVKGEWTEITFHIPIGR